MDAREQDPEPHPIFQLAPEDAPPGDDDFDVDDEEEEDEEEDDDEEDDGVDEASEESFPASDPPSFTGTGIYGGTPGAAEAAA